MIDKNGHEYDLSFTEKLYQVDDPVKFWCKYLGRSIKNGYRTYTFHYWCRPDPYDGGGWDHRDNCRVEIMFDDSDIIYAIASTPAGTETSTRESIVTMPEYIPLTRYIVDIEAESAIFGAIDG